MLIEAWGENLRWFPPFPRCVLSASVQSYFDFDNWWKKCIRKWSEIYCHFGVTNGGQMGPEIEYNLNISFDRMNKVQISTTCISKLKNSIETRPWKAWFWFPLSSENALFTFRHLANTCRTLVSKGLRNWSSWMSLGRETQEKRGPEIVKRKGVAKTYKSVAKCSQKEGLKKWSFPSFSRSGSSMVPRVVQGTVLGSKSSQNDVRMGGPNGNLGTCLLKLDCDYGVFETLPRIP